MVCPLGAGKAGQGYSRIVCSYLTGEGIRYQLPAFRKGDGSTRIKAIWDQTNQEGVPPVGYDYGTEFTEEEINANLLAGEALLTTDEIGHGTKVAGVAGGYDAESGFWGQLQMRFLLS